ncbi:50S ribosomal protein L24 [Candidatus Woesearchaeota archaeon]|nr:50S ribosomal protein L24 [Candidatus Woesearchaeota archaeon]
MAKNTFSTTWNRSIQPRKQRKYRYNAPLHVQKNMMHVHLASPLREKYGLRRIQARKGDKVRVVRGQFKKKEGAIERVNIKRQKVFVSGIGFIKKDGTKSAAPINPSNLLVLEADLSDKKRNKIIERVKSNKLNKSKASTPQNPKIQQKEKSQK